MKSWKWAFTIAYAFVFSAALVFNVYAVEQKPIKMVYSTFFSPTHIQSQLIDSWAKEIEKRTNGRVKITSFTSRTFFKWEDIHEGTVLGATDIGMSAFAYNRNRFPVMEAIDLPLGYPSAKVATAVINTYYNKFRPKELADMKYLYFHAHGPGLLHSKKSIHTIKDFKGLKIRSTVTSAKVTDALGAIPFVKPQGYTYVLLQDNYVDATWSPMEVLKAWRQAEVVHYTIESYCISYTTGFYVAMNLKKWNSLPKDVQQIFEEVSREWIHKHAEAWDAADREARKYSLELGNKILPLSQEQNTIWCKAVHPVIDDYIERTEKMGLPGKEYVETIRELIKKFK